MAAYTFKGTAIKITSGEGDFKIPGAKVGSTYFNTQTGRVFTCIKLHTDWQSKGWSRWRYTRTDICAKPNVSAHNLCAPARTAPHYMTTKWELYPASTNQQNGRRLTKTRIVWAINYTSGKKSNKITKTIETADVSVTESTVNLDAYAVPSGTFGRNFFYPLNKQNMLNSVTVTVSPVNSSGEGPKVSATRAFTPPVAPTIDALAFSAGDISTTVKSDDSSLYAERYNTEWVRDVYDSRTGKHTQGTGSSQSTSFPLSYDVADYQQLGYDDYIKVTFTAWNNGYAGKSKQVSKSYYVSYPAQTSIEGIDISSRDSIGKCTVRINTNYSEEHPVDKVQLQYLPNTTYMNPEDIPAEPGIWTATDITDDNLCTALSMPVGDLIPERGKRTWIRIKSWHASENILFRYSEYKCIEQLETPAATAEDKAIDVISAKAGTDGKSVVVALGWNRDGDDELTGTEVSWSTEEDTWKSTKNPDSYTFTWHDDTPIAPYGRTATITIKGLAEGAKYYIKARRYLEGDVTTYTEYSDTATCLTNPIPESVVANCDGFIPVGSSLPVYWTFSGNGVQTRWQIVTPIDDPATVQEPRTIQLIGGEGSRGFAQIPTERLETHASNGEIVIRVEASTGGDFAASEWKKVSIVEPPELSVTIGSTLTAQPLEISATATTPCDLLLIISSQGAQSQMPTGIMRQIVGDTIYSELISPEWTAAQDGFSTALTMPDNLDFWDLSNYTLSLTAIDRVTNLKSEEVVNSFAVEWEHKAPDMIGNVSITPVDEFDDNGLHHKAVVIDLTTPTGARETDVYDVYRMTTDGVQLVGTGLPLDVKVRDEFAPFGDDLTHYYRVAVRTTDGSVTFADFEYAAEGDYLRLDWDGYALESNYSVTISDNYKKDVEIRKHINGDVAGYWKKGVERKGSLSTDVIHLVQPNESALARNLARYAGPVFVRTPNGSAFEADVQVAELSRKNLAVDSIAIDATEIGLTREFMLTIVEEEEEP